MSEVRFGKLARRERIIAELRGSIRTVRMMTSAMIPVYAPVVSSAFFHPPRTLQCAQPIAVSMPMMLAMIIPS